MGSLKWHWHPPPPPVVHVLRSMGVCCSNHHLRPSFASHVQWGCVVPTTTSACRSCFAFDGGVLCQPPPPPSFASRVRWGCALAPISLARRSRLAIDGGVLCQPPPPPVVHVSCSMGWPSNIITSHSMSVYWLLPPPLVRASRLMWVSFDEGG